MNALFLFLIFWLFPSNAEVASQDCYTTFVVQSCGNKPVVGAKLEIYTDDRKIYKLKTDENGQATSEYCMLRHEFIPVIINRTLGKREKFDTKGDPQLKYIELTDSTYMYRFGEEVYFYDQYNMEDVLKVKMKYRGHKLLGGGISRSKYGGKMDLSDDILKGFLEGKHTFRNDTLFVGIGICK